MVIAKVKQAIWLGLLTCTRDTTRGTCPWKCMCLMWTHQSCQCSILMRIAWCYKPNNLNQRSPTGQRLLNFCPHKQRVASYVNPRRACEQVQYQTKESQYCKTRVVRCKHWLCESNNILQYFVFMVLGNEMSSTNSQHKKLEHITATQDLHRKPH